MNKVLRGLSLIGLSALTLAALAGCETGADRDLASAQSCLDSAHTEADANRCIDMVAGLSTPEANLVRCSANFIAQGFTGEKIAEAFESIDEAAPGADPMVTIMSFLNFNVAQDIAGDGRHDVKNVVRNCSQSGLQSMFRLATAADLATTLASISTSLPGVTIDPTKTPIEQMEQVVDDLKSYVDGGGTFTTDQLTAIVGVVEGAHGSFCNAGSTYEGEDICTDLGTALSEGTPTELADKIIELLKQG